MEKNNIKVSIIVPVYNVEKYLRQCLDSIISQTLKEIEIICLNDGSTDSSLSILEDYSRNDSRIRIISKSNSGYGHTMNTGIREAVGDYVGIIESDDFIAPGMYEKLYQEAVQHNVDVVKADFNYYWSKPQERISDSKLFDKLITKKVFNPRENFPIFEISPCVWAGLYKRSFLRDNNIQFLETPGASYQDIGFNFKVWLFAKSVYLLPEKFVFYRQDNELSSINNKNKVFCVCDEYDSIERLIDAWPESSLEIKSIVSRIKYLNYTWNLNRLGHHLRWQFIERMQIDYKKIVDEKRDFLFFPMKDRFKLRLIIHAPKLFFFLKKLNQSVVKVFKE